MAGDFKQIKNFQHLLNEKICFDAIDGDYMSLVGKSKLVDLKPLQFIGCTSYIEHCGVLLLESMKLDQLKDFEIKLLFKKLVQL